jgi:hypothetical protein
MKTFPNNKRRARERGWLMADLIVAIAILALVMLPLAFSLAQEMQLLRASYCRGAAMGIVDGEMEILVAGEWQAFADGTSAYVARGLAATNLPPGRLELTKSGKHLRLEWRPEMHKGLGPVVREVTVK